MLRYIFFGTPRFGELALGTLLVEYGPPAAVVTNPDRPSGRRKVLTPPPVKLFAQKHGIPVLQPEHFSSVMPLVSDFSFDVFVVAAYGKIIPKDILAIPRLGTIGIHPSLLPKYRGASPLQSTILSSDTVTGVTIFQVDEEVDHGPIIMQREARIADPTYLKLEEQLAKLGGEAAALTLQSLETGTVKREPQFEARATYTKKFTTQDGFVPWETVEAAMREGGDAAVAVDRKIRALNPEPGVWTTEGMARTKLLEAKVVEGKLKLTLTQRSGGKPVMRQT
jgi:methionyl-tRNA formyltransferase